MYVTWVWYLLFVGAKVGFLPFVVDALAPTTLPLLQSNNNRPVIRTAADYASYLEALLVTEYRDKVEELKEQRWTWSPQQLESRGVCITGASAVPDSELLGEKIVRLTATSKTRSWCNLFARGEVLLLTPEAHGGWQKYVSTKDTNPIPKECLVMDVGKDWMTVGVGTAWPAGLWEARKFHYTVRLDRTAPLAPLKAQRAALDCVRRLKGGSIVHRLARTFDPKVDAEELVMQLPSFLNRDTIQQEIQDSMTKALRKTTFRPNESQRHAIEWALQREIALVRGPPGTGKTRLASLLVATALGLKYRTTHSNEKKKLQSTRILAVTHSNGAADVLLEGLLQMGVPAVRLGRPASVGAHVQHRTVLALADKMPMVMDLKDQSRNMELSSQERSRAAFALRQTLADTQQMIIQTAPVVVTSCIGAHQLFLSASESNETDSIDAFLEFPIVVLDEAAQTTEPALVCALVAAKAKQLILVGDTKQLPPTVTSASLFDTLGVSPMQRLEDCGVGERTLEIQYRMPPALLKYPSEYFYKGSVICAPEQLKTRSINPSGFPWPSKDPLAFVHVGTGECEVTHSSGGRSNPTECSLIIRIIKNLLEEGDVEAKQISVISPYAKQVQLIRSEISALPSLEDVRIGTVDAFQGQETDIVVFSAVRSNALKEVGFLRDSRRLNVAITRSRRALILVGDRTTLRVCHHWDSLIRSLEERGCAVEADCILRSRKTSDVSVDDLFAERDVMKRLFGEEDGTEHLLDSGIGLGASSLPFGESILPTRRTSSSALKATFEFDYEAPDPGHMRYKSNLPSGFDDGTPAGIRGEAVRSALRSGRGVAWTWDETPSFSHGLVLVQGKGCLHFLNNKLSNSFYAGNDTVIFQEAGLLTSRGRLIDRVGVAIVDANMAFVQTSPGHTAKELWHRWDPFVFPLDEVKLTVVEDGLRSFSVAATKWTDIDLAFERYIRPILELSNSIKLPHSPKQCLYVTEDDGSLLLFGVPSVDLPSTAAVGYTFWCKNNSIWATISSSSSYEGPLVIGALEFESLRIQAGYPAYNAEITGRVEKEKGTATPATPMELHMAASVIDTEKGCYMGQEGIASVLKNPRGPPRLLYQVVFGDEFNLYDSETADEAPSKNAVENLTRLPKPGDVLYALGSNQEVTVGTLTSVAEPGSTGDPETLGIALVRRADSILQAMKQRELEIPRAYDIAEVDTSSGIVQPPPMDPLDGLEVIVQDSYTVGTLRSIPSRRLPLGQNMFVDQVPNFVQDLPVKGDSFGITAGDIYEPRPREGTKVSSATQQNILESTTDSVNTDDSVTTDIDSADQAALEEAQIEAEAAKAAAEAAAAEAERKAAKMEMLQKRAEEAMARRKTKKNELKD